jgi:hypothetical protein
MHVKSIITANILRLNETRGQFYNFVYLKYKHVKVKVNVKVKVTSDMPMQVQRGCGSIASTHSYPRQGDHTLATIPPGKDLVHISPEVGWGSGPVCPDAENLAPTGFLSPERPARNESL